MKIDLYRFIFIKMYGSNCLIYCNKIYCNSVEVRVRVFRLYIFIDEPSAANARRNILRCIQYLRPLFPSILKRTIGSSDKEKRLLSFLRVLYRARTATDSPRWLSNVVVLKPRAIRSEINKEQKSPTNTII